MDLNLIREFNEARDAGLDAIGAARFVAYQHTPGLPPLLLADAVAAVRKVRTVH